MKGSPLLRALAVFAIIATVGFPLWRLTRNRGPEATRTEQAVPLKELPMTLTFSVSPERFAIQHLGKVVWSEEKPTREVHKSIRLEYPPDGVDLQIEVLWPESENDAAVRVQLTDPGGNDHEQTVWGRGQMLETITFP